MSNDPMHPDEFVQTAYAILAKLGGEKYGRPFYEDDKIVIRKNYNGLDLEITRKPMPDISESLSGNNPTTMVKNGKVIRHHGEHRFITDHMRSLIEMPELERP